MKVAWSVLVGDGRGTVGTVTAFKGSSGPVLRGKTVFHRAASASQLQIRGAFATISQLWRSAAMDAYRFDWNTLAYAHPELDVFGNAIRKSGFSWFTRCNKTRDTFGLAPVLTAPDFIEPEDPTSLLIAYDSGPPETLTITASVAPLEDDAVILKATPGISPGRAVSSNLGKIIFTENPGTAGPWEVMTQYLAKFGATIPGTQIFVQVYYVNIPSGYPGTLREAATII